MTHFRKLVCSFMIIFFVFIPINKSLANNDQVNFRVAILDSPNMPPKLWTWVQYQKSYLRGINLAKKTGEQNGINIVYKTFFYGPGPLDILSEIQKVKEWQPDVILGPHYSNQFLLLRNYFDKILVLSSYASDKAVDALPNNFYSLSASDEVVVKTMVDFIDNKFKNKNILIINRADCKDCNNISSLVLQMFQTINPKVTIRRNNFIGESDEIKNPENLLNGYSPGDVIVILAANLYNYSELVSRLSATETLRGLTPIFISLEDNWGNPSEGLPMATNLELKYNAYLVNPLFFNLNSQNFKEFYEGYLGQYGGYPDETVSYVTFMTLTSVINAYNKYSKYLNIHNTVRQKVLQSYQMALKNDVNWYKHTTYAVYEFSPGNEKLVSKINMEPYLSDLERQKNASKK